MKRLFYGCAVVFLSISSLFAQYNPNDYFPSDSNIIKGTLKNGLTYYIRQNKEPKERASFYIIRNAGALLEDDHENGLAHFLEHMSFNGTKHFPKKGIISTLERYGVKFGGNLNAYTSLNETVYNISDVPTNIPNLLDTCLLILKDWTYYLSLEPDEIDAERGVITEEWRQRRDASFRIREKTYPVLMKGSKYAERDVIGSLDVIHNFKPEILKNFYHRWYRTDLTALAIVGDFDPQEMEKKFISEFADVPKVENPETVPFFEIPDHDETRFIVATDKEVRSQSIQIITVIRDESKPEDMNYAYFRNSFIQNFYNTLAQKRIGELIQKPNPSFRQASISYGNLVKGYSAYAITITPMPGKEDAALKDIVTENERIKRFGFLDSELERAKINMLASLESSYKQRDKTRNDSYVGPMKSNFLTGSPMVELGDYFNFAKNVIPTITAEEVSVKAQEWNKKQNKTIIITGPEDDTYLSKEEVEKIIEEVEHDNSITAFQEDVNLSEDLIAEELKGAPILKEKLLPQFDASEWTLGNGAKVVFRKADYEKDRVALASYSTGGTSLYGVDLIPAANNAAAFVASFGKGNYNPITLNKMLAGKLANVRPSISTLYESVDGACAPKDFETMLQLLYLTFEQPRFDETLYENIMERSRVSLKTKYNNPQNIIQDSIALIVSDYHPRTRLFDESFLDDISLEKIKQIYLDRFKDASDFTFFIVGNIEASDVKPLVEKYIGSIKSIDRKEKWADNNVNHPKGIIQKKIPVKMEEPKSLVFVNFNKKMKVTPYHGICATILQNILNLRYTESIREEEGGTYGVSVSATGTRLPKQYYSLRLSFNCEPQRAEFLKPLLYKELDNIVENGPKQEDLDKVISNLRKNREQSKSHNSYWMNTIYNYYRTGINNDDPKNFENIVNQITTKDIRKWAKKFRHQADIVDIIFYPKKNELQ